MDVQIDNKYQIISSMKICFYAMEERIDIANAIKENKVNTRLVNNIPL